MCSAPPDGGRIGAAGHMRGDRRQLLGRAHERRHGVAEGLLQRGLDPPFERRRIRDRAAEDDVAAGDECFDVGESGRGEDAAQLLHPHDVATDVDRAEERAYLGTWRCERRDQAGCSTASR